MAHRYTFSDHRDSTSVHDQLYLWILHSLLWIKLFSYFMVSLHLVYILSLVRYCEDHYACCARQSSLLFRLRVRALWMLALLTPPSTVYVHCLQ